MHNATAYIAQKRSESGYALVQAASLPYEHFSQANPPRVPSLSVCPEVQLSDIVTFSPNADASGTSYIEVYPDVFGGAATYRDPGSFNCVAGEYLAFQGSFFLTQTLVDTPAESCVVSANAEGNKFFFPGAEAALPLITSAATTVDLDIRVTTPANHMEFALSYLIAGTWTPNGYYAITAGSGVAVGAPFPANVEGMRVIFRAREYHSFSGTFEMGLKVVSGAIQASNDWRACQLNKYPYLADLPDVGSTRRLANATLVSYTGSALNNGGKIASAVVPFYWSPNGDDPYAAVASLRNDRYDGPLREGTDVTWRPHSITDFVMATPGSRLRPSSKTVIAMKFDDPLASVRVRSFMLAGIYSTNPIVGRMVYSPPITDEMLEALFAYYNAMPSCTDNNHHAILKGVKHMGAKALSGMRALLEHDTAIAAMLASAGQPELALAVKAAGSISKSKRKKSAPQPAPSGKAKKAGKPRRK